MDAVGTHHLTPVVTVYQVFIVLLDAFVRFLDTTARRGVVTGDGQTDHGTVGQIDGALYESFSEGTPAYYDTSVPILNGSGDNLTGGSREFIDEHHQTAFLEIAVALGFKF